MIGTHPFAPGFKMAGLPRRYWTSSLEEYGRVGQELRTWAASAAFGDDLEAGRGVFLAVPYRKGGIDGEGALCTLCRGLIQYREIMPRIVDLPRIVDSWRKDTGALEGTYHALAVLGAAEPGPFPYPTEDLHRLRRTLLQHIENKVPVLFHVACTVEQARVWWGGEVIDALRASSILVEGTQ